MPRYVILEHNHPELHWDLMLEANGALRTWRLLELPRPGVRVAAIRSFDHRLLYLDYEGPVSGDRGSVKRWDAGVFCWENLENESLQVRVQGDRLRGVLRLEQAESADWSVQFFAMDG